MAGVRVGVGVGSLLGEGAFEASEAFFGGDDGGVAEVAAGGGDVEPVGRAELFDDEAGEEGFAGFSGDSVAGFGEEGEDVCDCGGNAAVEGWQSAGAEDGVDEVPEGSGFALGEEVGSSAGRGGVVFVAEDGVLEGLGGEDVPEGGVVDVGPIDAFSGSFDAGEASGAGAFEESGCEVVVAGSPDEVGSEGDDAEIGSVGGEGEAFGLGLGARVGGALVAGPGEGQGLVGALDVASVEDDAGGGGEDEDGYAGFAAGFDDVSGAVDVDASVFAFVAPDAGLGGDVEDEVGAGDGASDSVGGGDVSDALVEAEAGEFGARGACESADSDFGVSREERADDGPAEESGVAGDEGDAAEGRDGGRAEGEGDRVRFGWGGGFGFGFGFGRRGVPRRFDTRLHRVGGLSFGGSGFGGGRSRVRGREDGSVRFGSAGESVR